MLLLIIIVVAVVAAGYFAFKQVSGFPVTIENTIKDDVAKAEAAAKAALDKATGGKL